MQNVFNPFSYFSEHECDTCNSPLVEGALAIYPDKYNKNVGVGFGKITVSDSLNHYNSNYHFPMQKFDIHD